MIHLCRRYTTRAGHEVTGLCYEPLTSGGYAATYPIKGSFKRTPRSRYTYAIWSIDGLHDVVWRSGAHRDLIPIGESK